eukprot:scaffold28279_cov31-Tisochrysis_lutea.AAC.1
MPARHASGKSDQTSTTAVRRARGVVTTCSAHARPLSSRCGSSPATRGASSKYAESGSACGRLRLSGTSSLESAAGWTRSKWAARHSAITALSAIDDPASFSQKSPTSRARPPDRHIPASLFPRPVRESEFSCWGTVAFRRNVGRTRLSHQPSNVHYYIVLANHGHGGL